MKNMVLAMVAAVCAAALAQPRPDLVERVDKGELAEARVSWWGYDAADSTPFIQAALSSRARKVVFDRMEGPWYSLPLKVYGKTGFEISFERGAELVAKRGAFTNKVVELLLFQKVKDVRLSGYGASIRMWRCDYARAPYCWSEWRHAVSFRGAENVAVEGLRIEESGGDGIYLLDVRGCVIRDVICDRNYRQGISVISAENLLIENCTLSNTRGTPPAAGIDFEPNNMEESLVDCVMRNCTISGNEGAGIDMALVRLNGNSRDVSFRFENCRVLGNRHGLRLGTENPPLNALKGVLEMRNCLFDRSEMGVTLNENDDMPIKIKLDGCLLREAAADGSLVETPMDGKWLAKFFPQGAAAALPDIRHVGDRALDRSKVHDSCPGRMAAFSPLRIRHKGHFVFHAPKAGVARFTARQWRLGAKGQLSRRIVRVTDAAGRPVSRIDMATIGEKESPFEVKVPSAGFYFFDVGDSGALFSMLSADVPVALDMTDTHVDLNHCEGALYLPVPEGGAPFAIFVGGSYPGEFVSAAVSDPAGREVWRDDAVMRWRMFFSPKHPAAGVWKLSLARPPKGSFDDFKCEVAGVPSFLFLSPEKYWTSAPAAGTATQDGFWVRDRISRCPTAPIKRPPHNRDELLEPIEYYTDEFLSQISGEGVNGLWIPIQFRELAKTPFVPEDPLAQRRVERLRSIVSHCAEYGVKIWLFAIEPRSMADDDPVLRAHPDCAGPRSWDGRRVSCLSSPATTNYLALSAQSIFSRVPGLGGLICITSGERPTTCFSLVGACNESPTPCERCAARAPGELHEAIAKALVDGMRAANPEARLISWFYHPQPKPTRAEWVMDSLRRVPDGATLVYNFESGCERVQCGRKRCGGDYWLSVPGPAAPFRSVAAAGRAAGRSVGAKIQVSCSHEIATLPYVPVPGLLYRKYRAMRGENVSTVLQCWFFGGTPGLMNRAAGELSRCDFSEGEDEFLLRLARRDWGGDAPVVARLWRAFSDAYAEYPLSNMIQYYGPLHASCAWDLLPDIEMRSLARTWRPDDQSSGDMVGEALADFSLEDFLAQMDRMCGPLGSPEIATALAALDARHAGSAERRRDLGVMKAMRNLFIGGRDNFAFYLARREGIFASRIGHDNARALRETAKMHAVIDRAESLTKEMIPLCRDDVRLGYHPEAETRQFTAEKLERRLGRLAGSRARLREIESELKAGRPWPRSRRENDRQVWKAHRDNSGAVVIEGTAPDGPGEVEVRTYDLCGTRTATALTVAPDADGRFRVVLPREENPRMRPEWIVVRRGRDFNNGGTRWIWPKRPEFHEPRLNQLRLTGDNFARLEIVD